MIRSLLRVVPLLTIALPVFARMPAFNDLASPSLKSLSDLEAPGRDHPVPPPPQPVELATYATDSEFTFESDAKPALEERLAAFRNAGITTLGGRVFVKPNRRWTFVVEYIPVVQHGTQTPPAVLLQTYRSGTAYWRDSDAEAAMNAAASNLRNAGLSVFGASLVDAGRDHSFDVEYFVPNMLRPSQQYEPRIEKHVTGKFTFESQAEAAVADFTSLLAQAGVPVLHGRAVKRPDRDYSVELEYVVRTNRFGPRPLYSISRYDSRDIFPFEDDAVKAAAEKLPAFGAAGVPPVHGFSRKVNRDYSFSVDFLVKTLYQSGGSYPSAVVKTYQAQETFTFESEARTALEEKTAYFNNAGFSVVGSKVLPSGRDYTYVLDYIAKAQPGAKDARPR
ncbi:MAG: hypothetical protein HZB91_09840 [Elusimicrobia bacterium]|nr:hypothetical protein [Elusimicrobiota bacterium]